MTSLYGMAKELDAERHQHGELRAAYERLRAENEALRNDRDRAQAAVGEHKAIAFRFAAENERLRVYVKLAVERGLALEEAYNNANRSFHNFTDWENEQHDAIQNARNLLCAVLDDGVLPSGAVLPSPSEGEE